MNYLNIFKKIINIIQTKAFGYILAGILFLFLLYTCNKNNQLQYENKKIQQNIIALKDTVKNYKTKFGEAEARKNIFISKTKNLQKHNKDLKKELKKTSGKVSSLTKAVIKLKQDTTLLKDSLQWLHQKLPKPKITDSTINFSWKLRYNYGKENYDIFEGKSMLTIQNKNPLNIFQKDTRLINRETSISLTWGQRMKNEKLEVFVRSPYPGFNVKKMDGVLIDPKTNPIIQNILSKKEKPNKKWFTGFSLSVGVTPYYNFNSGKMDIVIGPTIGYTIFEF